MNDDVTPTNTSTDEVSTRTAWGVGLATVGCAVAGSLLTDPDSHWYRNLEKPPWQPPPAAFPIVWSSLYAAIGVSAVATIDELDRQGRGNEARAFRIAYGVNLVLNAGWSGMFFRAHRPWLATVWSAALALSAADLTRRAASAGAGRAVAFGAYTAWSSFATALAGSIARRNAQRNG